MKILFSGFKLCLIFAILFSGKLFSQCTPDPLAIAPGVSPADIPHAIAGQRYVVVLTIVVPTDTVVVLPGGTNVTVPIDSIGIDSIKGLPPGFRFATNSHSNFWHGGTKGCFILDGKSNTASGDYNLVFYLRGHTPIILPPYTTATGFVIYQYTYKMYVDVIEQNFPNPCYNGKTKIPYASSAPTVDFKLYDYSGNTLLEKTIKGNLGYNVYDLDLISELGHIANGLYFYSIDDGNTKVVRKLLVDMIQ